MGNIDAAMVEEIKKNCEPNHWSKQTLFWQIGQLNREELFYLIGLLLDEYEFIKRR